ncbi:hypothetical protein H2200_005052 [Cladophialophora chaetospira]|uniref:Uncharacterized protein n=1 Tax=Cladophialophora chaetospira TaxID=386627 RepID=A0AA39CJ95_9EURO|nr:hypothetical protein H2200_005052 [Cladophialophora chaetospira]
MKVLDPQSALLTTSEVHDFLLQNPPRAPPRKIGSYVPISLNGYKLVRDDFQEYISSTVPHVADYPPPETFIKNVVPKLRTLGLSKTEAYMAINLGVGLGKRQQVQQSVNASQHTNGDVAEEEGEGTGAADDQEQENPAQEEQDELYQPSDTELLTCVIEEWEDRYPGEEGQEQLQKISETIREEYQRAQSTHATTNGGAGGEKEMMDVS